jgi:hypothetical protein
MALMRGFKYQRCEDIVDRKLMLFIVSAWAVWDLKHQHHQHMGICLWISMINDGCLMIFLGIIHDYTTLLHLGIFQLG